MMFIDKLNPRRWLSDGERARLQQGDPTPAQRERLLTVTAHGGAEWPEVVVTQRRLEFARDLVEHERIGGDDRG